MNAGVVSLQSIYCKAFCWTDVGRKAFSRCGNRLKPYIPNTFAKQVKATGDVAAKVRAEEIFKVLNAWDLTKL